MAISSQPQPAQPTIVEKKKIPVVVFILAGIALLAASASAGYWLATLKTANNPVIFPNNTKTESKTTTNQDADFVKFSTPKQIDSLRLFIPQSQNKNEAFWHDESQTGYYDVGRLEYSNETTAPTSTKLIMTISQVDMGENHYLFAVAPDKAYLLTKYSDYIDSGATEQELQKIGLLTDKINIDTSFTIPSLEFPPQLTGPEKNQKLYFVKKTAFDEKPVMSQLMFEDKNWGKIYTSTSTDGFYIDNGEPYVGVYAPQLNYLAKKIIMNDGTVNEDGYTETNAISICGTRSFANVVYDGVNKQDLVGVGKTPTGDKIYALTNSQHPLLKDFYDTAAYFIPGGETKISYDDFLKEKPLLFAYDQFNRLIELTKVKFQPMGECGKPVIYLYPEKTTAVSVKLAPNGGFTYTEPVYDNGWEVMAEPNGALTEIKTGKAYPYLFWEGNGSSKSSEPNKKGFVVAKENVKKFLDEKLALLGLNAKESADFEEFWLPRMQEKPYYFVTFYGKQMMDEIAPLAVTPKPDTIIRILMDFTPLASPMAVEEQKLSAPARQGFTVVEWGGVLR
ncbi:hypothetical protein EPN28_00005 [Patescibacteria group bacterium]|nr:MAG: hypothetical protein EPN28_00005 [Patescibacteria group bacterium]